MRTMNMSSFVRRVLNDQSGQMAPTLALVLLSLLGMAGLTIDVGQAYVVRSQLQTSANAAALASAQNVYNTGALDSAIYLAKKYSAVSASSGSDAGNNVNPGLGTVHVDVTTPCLNILMPSKSGCTNDSSGNAVSPSNPNAVRIVQSATVPTTFMRVFGKAVERGDHSGCDTVDE